MVDEAMALRASPVAFRFELTVTLEWVRQQIVQLADERGWSSEVGFVLSYVAICCCLLTFDSPGLSLCCGTCVCAEALSA